MEHGVELSAETLSPKSQMTSPIFYRVKLDVFEGPLDLLLHLVKKEEVDLSNIPIAKIPISTWAN